MLLGPLFRKPSSGQSRADDLRSAVLRDERTPGDVRHLSVRYASNGDLRIEGQDVGQSVESFFGSREYEWSWTVARSKHPKFLKALGVSGDLIAALKARFSGDDAAELEGFLKSHRIPFSVWSRVGD